MIRDLEAGHPSLELEEVGDVTIARLLDRSILEEHVVKALGRQLSGLVGQAGRSRLVLDFGMVEHLTSLVVAVVLKLHQETRAAGGRLAVCALRPDVGEAFSLTGLHRVLAIYSDEQGALQSFSGRRAK